MSQDSLSFKRQTPGSICPLIAEYKNYILAFMFYRYLSVHQERYLVENNVLDIAAGESINKAYLEQANGDDLNDYLEDISSSLGYAIAPLDTWESLVQKIDNSMVIPSDYQTIFDNFNVTGTMAIVLPHGVLFRGAAEGTIRQTIIEKNYLDTVIGLPANLFYGVSIPTTILVFKKNR